MIWMYQMWIGFKNKNKDVVKNILKFYYLKIYHTLQLHKVNLSTFMGYVFYEIQTCDAFNHCLKHFFSIL
jgi:hypothetical protein